VETRLAYRYVPYVNQDNVPPFETLDEAEHFLDPLETWTLVDRINAANYMKVAVVNRFFVQGTSTSPARNLREVARLTLSQGFDVRAATHGERNPLGPLDIETTVRLWQRWWLDSTLRIATATGTLEEANWHVGVTLFPGWSAHIAGRHRIDPGILYVSGGIEVELLKGLHLGYSMRYDGRDGAFREHFASLLYEAQCWSVDMRFRMRDAGDTEFFVRANLFRL
jgi:hypothetical protein